MTAWATCPCMILVQLMVKIVVVNCSLLEVLGFEPMLHTRVWRRRLFMVQGIWHTMCNLPIYKITLYYCQPYR